MRLYRPYDPDFPAADITVNDALSSAHWDVHCDGCGNHRLVHYRYKCLRCVDYDLCATCKENGVVTGQHELTHPVQCLMDRAALELHFAGEPLPKVCADSFTCPVCGKMGLSFEELRDHCKENHRMSRTSVICPVCAAVPLSMPIRIGHIASHLIFMHTVDVPRIQDATGASEGIGFTWPVGLTMRSLGMGPGPGNGTGLGAGDGAGDGTGVGTRDGTIGGTGGGARDGTGDGAGVGTVSGRTLPIAQNPQVRFVLPRNTPSQTDSDDFSDSES